MPADRQAADWQICADAAELADRAADIVANAARHAIDQRDAFRIALAGGTTPRRLYQQLRHLDTRWTCWHVYYGDERCAPVGDAQRNDTMARCTWLEHVPIPPDQVHSIPAELGPTQGAHAYAAELATSDRLDMVLLGMGEDGHTASLFPGAQWGPEDHAPLALPVFDAPKPPPERVTLSLKALNAARQILVLVDGANKQNAVAAWRAGENLPVAKLRAGESLAVFLTRAAVPV